MKELQVALAQPGEETPEDKVISDELREKLGRELADTFIYLDLLAQSCGVDMSYIVPRVFNAKSKEIGYPVTID